MEFALSRVRVTPCSVHRFLHSNSVRRSAFLLPFHAVGRSQKELNDIMLIIEMQQIKPQSKGIRNYIR